jgi:hypothetical protein
MAMPKHVEQDEFEQQAAADAAIGGYEGTRNAPVEDQREYRPIPVGTECIFDVVSFDLNTKKNPYIFAKLAVQVPEAYADGSSDFGIRMSLNPVVGKNEDGRDKRGSGWTFTRDRLTWMFAAVNQCDAATAKRELLDPVYEQFPSGIGTDDVAAFREALVAQLNEALKGRSFPATAGEEPAQLNKDGSVQYRARATIQKFSYPKAQAK